MTECVLVLSHTHRSQTWDTRPSLPCAKSAKSGPSPKFAESELTKVCCASSAITGTQPIGRAGGPLVPG